MKQLIMPITMSDGKTYNYILPCAKWQTNENGTSTLVAYGNNSKYDSKLPIQHALKDTYDASPSFYELNSGQPGYCIYYGAGIDGDVGKPSWKTTPTTSGLHTEISSIHQEGVEPKYLLSYPLYSLSKTTDFITPSNYILYADYMTIDYTIRKIQTPMEFIVRGKLSENFFNTEDIATIKKEIETNQHLIVGKDVPSNYLTWKIKNYLIYNISQDSSDPANQWLITTKYHYRLPLYHDNSDNSIYPIITRELTSQSLIAMNYVADFIIQGYNSKTYTNIFFNRPSNIKIDKLLCIKKNSTTTTNIIPTICSSNYGFQKIEGTFTQDDSFSYYLNIVDTLTNTIYGQRYTYLTTSVDMPTISLWDEYTLNNNTLTSSTNITNNFSTAVLALSDTGYPRNWSSTYGDIYVQTDSTGAVLATTTSPKYSINNNGGKFTIPAARFDNEYQAVISAKWLTTKSNAKTYYGNWLVSNYRRLIVNNGYVNFSFSNSASNQTINFVFNGILPTLKTDESYQLTVYYVSAQVERSQNSLTLNTNILDGTEISLDVPASNRTGIVYYDIINTSTNEIVSNYYWNATQSYANGTIDNSKLIVMDQQPLNTFIEFKEPIIQAFYSNKWSHAVAEDEYMTGAMIYMVATNDNDVDIKMNYEYKQYQNNQTVLKTVTKSTIIQAHRCAVIDCSISGIDSNDDFSMKFSCDYTDKQDRHIPTWYTYNGYVGFSSSSNTGSEEFTAETHETTTTTTV